MLWCSVLRLLLAVLRVTAECRLSGCAAAVLQVPHQSCCSPWRLDSVEGVGLEMAAGAAEPMQPAGHCSGLSAARGRVATADVTLTQTCCCAGLGFCAAAAARPGCGCISCQPIRRRRGRQRCTGSAARGGTVDAAGKHTRRRDPAHWHQRQPRRQRRSSCPTFGSFVTRHGRAVRHRLGGRCCQRCTARVQVLFCFNDLPTGLLTPLSANLAPVTPDHAAAAHDLTVFCVLMGQVGRSGGCA